MRRSFERLRSSIERALRPRTQAAVAIPSDGRRSPRAEAGGDHGGPPAPPAPVGPNEAGVLEALGRIGGELIAAAGTPRIAERFCQLLAETLECDCAFTALRDEERNFFRCVAASGFPPEDQQTLETLRLPPDALSGLLGALREHDAVQVTTVDPPTPWASLPARYGVTRVLYVALERAGEVVGVQAAGFRGRIAPFTRTQERIARATTHLALLAIENARRIETLRRSDHVKSEFLSTMSHEFRTPLNIIIGYNDLLLDQAFGALTPEQKEALVDVRRSAGGLLGLIDAILELSRLEAGDVPLDIADVEIRQVVRELLEEARRHPRARGQSALSFTFAPERDLPVLRSDPRKLRALLRNLIDNAVKFTDEGGVTVEARRDGEAVEIAVRDTGVGIPPHVLPVIFERFRQGEASATRRHGGVGLGLHVARRLASLISGSITVESREGEGSTFRVRLPLHLKDPRQSATRAPAAAPR